MQTLASVAVGSLVKLNEGGSPVEFYVSKHDYESSLNGAGRTLVVRKDTYDNRVWDDGHVNAWANCDLRAWLNSTYKTILDSDVQEAIGTTTYYYTRGNGNNTVTTRSDAVFILSVTELGKSYINANVEGSALPIASTLQIAYHNGSATIQWTRSPLKDRTSHVWELDANGNISGNGLNVSCGSRPAFTLPGATTYVTDDGTIILTQPPSAPGSITLGTVTAGQSCEITWTAATDPDGTIASYTLERSVNGSGWTQVFSGNALTYTDTVGQDWATVAYRVCAVDNYGANGPYATSETSVVNAGVLYISGPATPMGEKTAPFAFTISTGVSGSSGAVTDIAVEISMDGNQLYSGTVDTGEEVSVTIDPRVIGGGSHTVEVSASKENYVAASQSYTFTTPSLSLPAGGLGTQLQDNQGRPIFPQSVAALIGGLYGQSVAANLQQLVKGVLYNRTQTPKYQEVTVDLSTAQEGDIIQLPEGGQMVDFYVAKLNYEQDLNGAGRTLLVRKDAWPTRVAWNSSGVNTYANSTIDTWLNGEYKSKFPQDIQTAMGTTKFYYTPMGGNKAVGQLERSVFILSIAELGLTYNNTNAEGSTLPIAGTLQTIKSWTRTPVTVTTSQVVTLPISGGVANTSVSGSGITPAPIFTLPNTFTGTYLVDPTGTVHASQEYTEGGTFTDYLGNVIPVPRVETGSYVGTGTAGQAFPNKLTFDFEPQLVFIFMGSNTINNAFGFFVRGCQWAPTEWDLSGSDPGGCNVTWGSNYIEYYATGGVNPQLNNSIVTYNYVAIGMPSPSGVILETPSFEESSDIVWNFSIPSGIKVPENGAVDVTVTMTRAGATPNWTSGRYVTYSVEGADGSGTTAEPLVRASADTPAPTFTIPITNATSKTVAIRITGVSMTPG